MIPDFWCGVLVGAAPAVMLGVAVAGLIHSDLMRVRRRLTEIILFARHQDREWTRRRMTGDDWNELVLLIQPYEDVA